MDKVYDKDCVENEDYDETGVQELAKVVKELQEQEKQNNDLLKQVENAQQKIDELEQTVIAKDNQINKTEQQKKEELKILSVTKEKEVNDLKGMLNKMETNATQNKGDKDEMIAELEASQVQMETHKREIASLNAKIVALNETIQSKCLEIGKMESEMIDPTVRKAMKDSIAEKEAEISDMKEHCEFLNGQMKDLKTNNNQLKVQLESSKKECGTHLKTIKLVNQKLLSSRKH